MEKLCNTLSQIIAPLIISPFTIGYYIYKAQERYIYMIVCLDVRTRDVKLLTLDVEIRYPDAGLEKFSDANRSETMTSSILPPPLPRKKATKTYVLN